MVRSETHAQALVTALKRYDGAVPSCGVFCGGCPNYVRDRKPCPGASRAGRCDRCKTFHLCCSDRGITHCHQCDAFPCRKFKGFARRLRKYGQDFLDNQRLLREAGAERFLEIWNGKAGPER